MIFQTFIYSLLVVWIISDLTDNTSIDLNEWSIDSQKQLNRFNFQKTFSIYIDKNQGDDFKTVNASLGRDCAAAAVKHEGK